MIIDSHMHLIEIDCIDKEFYKRFDIKLPKETDLDQLVMWWKKAGISKMVSMGQDMQRIFNSRFAGDYVKEAFQRYPDFIIPFTSLEPMDKANRFNLEAYQKLEKDITEGITRGVLMTPPYGHYKANDKTAYPFYQLAQKHGLIIQYHHSAMNNCPAFVCPTKYCQMEDLNDVVIDFPKMKVVVEHLGYPFTEHLLTILSNSDRIYSDLAMAYDRPMTVAWALVQAREYGVINKIMFATDFVAADSYPFSANPVNEITAWTEFIKTGLNEINKRCGWPQLTQAEIDGILFRNAERLYELDINDEKGV